MRQVFAFAFLLALPAATSAQGAISNQGFGYPAGQLGGAARGAGGSSAETDPSSPINPAALTQSNRYSVVFQFEPEFRRTSIGGNSGTSRVVRFPAFSASGSYKRLSFGASVSTFLDRTWENQYSDSVMVDGTMTESAVFAKSDGAIGDARLALAYVLHPKLQVGLGLHSFSGENRVSLARLFPDSLGLLGVTQVSSVNYVGRAMSLGFVAHPVTGLVVSASTRFGGALMAEQLGAQVGEAKVPARFGVGVSWLALPGASINARMDRTAWTDMDDLGSADLVTFDATEFGVGVDLLGPTISGVNSVVRLGGRDRTLPFGVNGDQVIERAFSGGIGLPVGRGRAQLDIALERAARRGAGATERAWFVSVGIGIRP